MSQPNPSYQRAKVFYEQKRYAEAEKYFYEALSVAPRNTAILYELAFSQYMQKGREKIGLETIQSAIAIEPNESHFHALAALILSALGQSQPALKSAQRAVELAPEERLSFVALSSAHLSAENWIEAEKAAREALRLDPTSFSASSILIHALRVQGKKEEAKVLIEQSLARDPERVLTRHNAGWVALQRGEVHEAKEHFGETLRLDPQDQYNTNAREGFLRAIKTKSIIYRNYLKFSIFMEKFHHWRRYWIYAIFLVPLIILLPDFFKKTVGLGIGVLFFGLNWVFFLWGHLAQSVGNLILLKDPLARRILSASEKRTAYLTGGGFLLGPILIGLGLWLGKETLIVGGGWLFGLIIPLNFYSNSESKIEKVLLAIMISFYFLAILLCLVKTFYMPPNWKISQAILLVFLGFILPAIWSRINYYFFEPKN